MTDFSLSISALESGLGWAAKHAIVGYILVFRLYIYDGVSRILWRLAGILAAYVALAIAIGGQ
jgi:hypothetical protein